MKIGTSRTRRTVWGRTVRRGLAVVAIPVAAGGVAGCTGNDPSPSTSTTTTSSSSTTSTMATTTTRPPTSAVSDVPAAARAHTPAGAEAFVKYFLDEFNLSWTEPSASRLEKLCLVSSKSCASYVQVAKELKAKGQHYRSSPVTLKDFAVLTPLAGTERVLGSGVQNRVDIVNADGSVASTDLMKPFKAEYWVDWSSGAWAVSQIKLVVSS